MSNYVRSFFDLCTELLSTINKPNIGMQRHLQTIVKTFSAFVVRKVPRKHSLSVDKFYLDLT